MFPNSKVYLYVLYEYLVGIPQTLTPFILLSFHYLGLRGFVDKRFKLLCEQYETAELNLRTMIADNFND
jgi:hypothetical protein